MPLYNQLGDGVGGAAHSELTGLTADDHTHYLLTNGTRDGTGAWRNLASLTARVDAVGVGVNDGWVAENTTAAAVGAQQYSPLARLRGSGWETDVGSSMTVEFATQVRPVQGAAAPTGALHWLSQVNGAGWTSVWSLSDTGTLAAANATGPVLMNEASTSANPTLIPHRDSLTTGIGGGSGEVVCVVGGGRIFTATAGGVQVNGVINPDATGTRLLGGAATRWSNVFSVLGDFSGAVDSDVSLSVTQTIVASATATPMVTLTGAAHTALTASTESSDVYFNLARTVQFGTGALATQRAIQISAPTYGFVDASTITTATTLDIDGPPIAGTNATITTAWVIRGGFDTDANFGLGRLRIDSRTTDEITLSHVDQTAAGSFALVQNASGATVLNAATGQTVSLSINDVQQFALDTTNGFYGNNAGAGAILNEAATSSNPTLVPDRSDLTTGIGGAGGGQLDLVSSGATRLQIVGTTAFWFSNPVPSSAGSQDLGSDARGWQIIYADQSAIGAVSTDAALGGRWMNSTAAAAGAQQYSPMIVLEGQGWKTDSVAASQEVQFGMQVIPVEGTANPTGALHFFSNINDGGWTSRMNLSSGGILSLPETAGGTVAALKLSATTETGWSGHNTNQLSAVTDGTQLLHLTTSGMRLKAGHFLTVGGAHDIGDTSDRWTNLYVKGFLDVAEMTAPTGLANSGRVFCQDDGAGKTQLMVIFGTGVAQQLAIEV